MLPLLLLPITFASLVTEKCPDAYRLSFALSPAPEFVAPLGPFVFFLSSNPPLEARCAVSVFPSAVSLLHYPSVPQETPLLPAFLESLGVPGGASSSVVNLKPPSAAYLTPLPFINGSATFEHIPLPPSGSLAAALTPLANRLLRTSENNNSLIGVTSIRISRVSEDLSHPWFAEVLAAALHPPVTAPPSPPRATVDVRQSVTGRGSHRELKSEVTVTPAEEECICEGLLLTVLPSSVFVDPNEILLSAAALQPVDIEAPATRSLPTVVVQAIAGRSSNLTLPIHLRYLPAEIGGEPQAVILPLPSVQLTCSCDSPSLPPPFYFGSPPSRYRPVPHTVSLTPSTLFVPVAHKEDQRLVTVLSLFFTGIAGIVTWIILS